MFGGVRHRGIFFIELDGFARFVHFYELESVLGAAASRALFGNRRGAWHTRFLLHWELMDSFRGLRFDEIVCFFVPCASGMG